MKNFFAYKIYTQPFDPELISGLMWELEDDDHITVFTSDNSSANEGQFNFTLMKLKNEKLIESFLIEKEILEDTNWNEIWEKSREVIRVSDKIIIKPTFQADL